MFLWQQVLLTLLFISDQTDTTKTYLYFAPLKAVLMGFEPTISAVTGQRPLRWTAGPISFYYITSKNLCLLSFIKDRHLFFISNSFLLFIFVHQEGLEPSTRIRTAS